MPTLLESLDVLPLVQSTSSNLTRQTVHRVNLFQSWLQIAQENNYDLESNIVGKTTLDIGCGQGDMIAVFAAILQAQGNTASKVIGVDPASLDYGTPLTLGEAQAMLSNGPLRDHLSFEQATAPALVASRPVGDFTTACFVHSLYYFPSSATLVQNFQALLSAGVQTLLLAEWSLSISRPMALPHLLAVLLQSIDPLPHGNVRTVLSPVAYLDAATQAGWELVGSRLLTPALGQQDGRWETGFARTVAKKSGIGQGATRLGGERSPESQRLESLRSHLDALESSVGVVGGLDRVECMDVWIAVFKPRKGLEQMA